MPRRPTEPKAETKRRILDAAMQLWAEKGYGSATMRELARRVGMSASGLYQHFDSKEAIVLHFYVQLNERTWAAFDEAGPSGDVGADLQRFLGLKLARLAGHRSAATGLLREAIDPNSPLSPLHPASDGTLSANIEGFASWVEAAGLAKGEEAADLGRALWMLHIAAIVFWLHDRSDHAALTDRLLGRLSNLSQLLPFMNMVPGLPDLLALFREVVDRQPRDASEAPTVAHDASYDVIVIGGGPIGCLTACFLKQLRPRTRIAVLESAPEPTYKVGESTLSGFCKALRTIGIRHEAMQTLFFSKNGLGFTWAGEGTTLAGASEYVLETFDETFQVERRVLDALVLAQTRRLGVVVLQGASVDLDACRLASDDCTVVATIGTQQVRYGARWVVDATGPRASIARKRGLWNHDGVAFQSHAMWAAFEGNTPLAERSLPGNTQFPRDEYTWHLCFRQGWAWWIPQVSWEQSPRRNLDVAIDALLREGKLPDRAALGAMGCPHTERVSVGVVVRSDRDDLGVTKDPEAAFATLKGRLPVLAELLEGASVVPDLTPAGPWQQRNNLRGHAREVVGDGWLAVGDAAFFVDPLISPGLTGGTATAWHAAKHLASALDTTLSVGHFSDYQASTLGLYQALELDNQLVYHSFDHPELMEIVQRFQEVTARTHFRDGEAAYGEQDTNVWGILDPAYAERARELHGLLASRAAALDARVAVAEQTLEDHAETVRLANELVGAHLERHAHLTPYVAQNVGRS